MNGPEEPKLRAVTLQDFETSSPDYRLVTGPWYRNEAVTLIKSFYKTYSIYKKLTVEAVADPNNVTTHDLKVAHAQMIATRNQLKMNKLQEPVESKSNNNMNATLISCIKNHQYNEINYSDPEFTRRLFAVLRSGKISMNEMMTAKLMYESLTCFNSGRMPSDTSKCFSKFALDDPLGPYIPAKEISHWTPENSQQLKADLNSTNNEYYTIDFSHHQMVAYFKMKLNRFTKVIPNEFAQLLRSYIDTMGLEEAEKSRMHQYVVNLESKYSASDVIQLELLILRQEPDILWIVKNLYHPNLNKYGIDSKQLVKEHESLLFIFALENVDSTIPMLCRSPNYSPAVSNIDSPVLSFVLPTINTLNTLQQVVHGKDTTMPVAVVGPITTRIIRAYDEAGTSSSELQVLYPMAKDLLGQSRPIETTHRDTKKTLDPHGYNHVDDFLLTWHDIFHAWRNGSNYKPLIRKLRELHDTKAGLSTTTTVMSKAIWTLTDVDCSVGKGLKDDIKERSFTKEFRELRGFIYILKGGGFDFTKSLDDNYLLNYSLAKYAAEWHDLIDLRTYTWYAKEVVGASEFFTQQQSIENYLVYNPNASIVEIILHDLLKPEQDSDLDLLKQLRSKKENEIFYWSKNSGVFFQKAVMGEFVAEFKNLWISPNLKGQLRGLAPDKIRSVLANILSKKTSHDAPEPEPEKPVVRSYPIIEPVDPDKIINAFRYAMLCAKPDILVKVLESGGDLNIEVLRYASESNMISPIEWAVEMNHKELLNKLLAKYLPSEDQIQRILQWAMLYDDSACMLRLLSAGCSLNIHIPRFSGSSRMISPLEWALENNYAELFAELFAELLKKCTPSKEQIAGLFTLAMSGEDPVYVLHLLSSGCDLNIRVSKSKFSTNMISPLEWAIQKNNIDALKVCIARGADVNLASNEGRLPLDCAQNAGIAKLLIQAGANVSEIDAKTIDQLKVSVPNHDSAEITSWRDLDLLIKTDPIWFQGLLCSSTIGSIYKVLSKFNQDEISALWSSINIQELVSHIRMYKFIKLEPENKIIYDYINNHGSIKQLKLFIHSETLDRLLVCPQLPDLLDKFIKNLTSLNDLMGEYREDDPKADFIYRSIKYKIESWVQGTDLQIGEYDLCGFSPAQIAEIMSIYDKIRVNLDALPNAVEKINNTITDAHEPAFQKDNTIIKAKPVDDFYKKINDYIESSKGQYSLDKSGFAKLSYNCFFNNNNKAQSYNNIKSLLAGSNKFDSENTIQTALYEEVKKIDAGLAKELLSLISNQPTTGLSS